MWLLLDPPNQRKILIGTVYRPPDGKASLAIDTLNDILSSLGKLRLHG